MNEKTKGKWRWTFFGIFLVAACVVFSHTLVVECLLLNGAHALKKVLVWIDNRFDPDGSNGFSLTDLKRLKRELGTEELSYTVESGLINTVVVSGDRALPVKLTGVDYMYPMFNRLILAEGSPLTQKQEEEGAMVAVIDGDLAWELFKTTKATGRTLEILGGTFRVIGVAKKDPGLTGQLTKEDLPAVYIPAAVFLERDATARITALQIKAENSGLAGENITPIETALRQIGKDPDRYRLIDYNIRQRLMEQVPLLFRFLLGMFTIILLLAQVKENFVRLYVFLKEEGRTNYFFQVIKGNSRKVGIYLLQIGLRLVGIVLIVLVINFKLYIPPEYIPEDLIDVSFYLSLLKRILKQGQQSLGSQVPRPQLIADTVTTLLNALFSGAVVFGAVFFSVGFRKLQSLAIRLDRSLLSTSLLLLFSLLILVGVAITLESPLLLPVKDLMLVWTFLLVSCMQERKGR